MAEAKRSMKFGDKEYAFVPDRIKEFREQNPWGDIDTVFEKLDDGSGIFRTTILRDRSDPSSARGTGTARYSAEELKKPKAFEKLETISVGRALAMIGYLNDGQVATTEELEELAEYKEQQRLEKEQSLIDDALAMFPKMNTMAELKECFALYKELWNNPVVVAAKEARKAELQDEADAAAKAARPIGGKVVGNDKPTEEPTDEK